MTVSEIIEALRLLGIVGRDTDVTRTPEGDAAYYALHGMLAAGLLREQQREAREIATLEERVRNG